MIGRLVPVLLAAGLLAAGCGSSTPPTVTFGNGGATVTAKPTQYCDLKLQDCQSDANAPVTLAVPAGAAVTVTVPKDVSDAPWQVVFTYRSANGTQTDGRSPVLAPGQHPDYRLVLPATTDRLLTAQVQQYGPAPQANAETGEVDFPIRGSWILNTTP